MSEDASRETFSVHVNAAVQCNTVDKSSEPHDTRTRAERIYQAVEYVVATCVATGFFVYGFCRLFDASRRHTVSFAREQLLGPPMWFMQTYFSSVAYDVLIDVQWSAYCLTVPLLAALAAAMAGLTVLARRRGGSQLVALLYAAFGVGFVTVVHGPLFFMLLLTLSVSYVVFTRLRRVLPRGPFLAVLWVVQVGFLYYVQEHGGFEKSGWAQRLFTKTIPNPFAGEPTLTVPLWPIRLRWSVALRMSTLRMIAYHSDELECARDGAAAAARAARKHDTCCVECAALREAHGARCDDSVRCYKYRTEQPRDACEYGYVRYMAYVLFTPLYIGGPITSYNAFASHLRTPSRAMPLRTMAVYVVRIGFVYVVNVFLLHFVFVNCFSSSRVALQSLSNGDRAFLMLYALALLWLKFTFIWRTSRLFALWCGVEAPENMRRCFANSLTVRDFWRDWHASFNLWIVRYMYIPMGGRRHQLLAVAPIFLFVALWHDHTLSMLKWAACIVVFFLLETIVSGVFQRASQAVSAALSELDAHDGECVHRGVAARVARCLHGRLSPRARRCAYHFLCRLAGSALVVSLIVANLVGFHNQSPDTTHGSQTDATLLGLLLSVSWQFWLGLTVMMVCGAAAAMDLREEEARRLDVRMWQLGLCRQSR